MKIKRTTIFDAPTGIRLQTGMGKGQSDELEVDREGGQFKAGVVKNFSIITRGEALGHDMWVDSDFLDQVVEYGGKLTNGVKARFTHPGLSTDGLGTGLGRVRNFRRDGDRVIGDMHFTKSSHATPKGDLSGHIMDLAEETPEDFGASIVFHEDMGAIQEFMGKHSDKDGDFTSPDKLNEKNLPHTRLSDLNAVDMVGEPAANPGGLFSATPGNEIPAYADALLSYAFGLTTEQPEQVEGMPHPERVKRFVTEWQYSNKLLLAFDGDQGSEILATATETPQHTWTSGFYSWSPGAYSTPSTYIERNPEQERAIERLKRENRVLREQVSKLNKHLKTKKEDSK